MRILRPLLLALSVLGLQVFAQDDANASKQRHDYQSDVARLRKIVINSLYSHRKFRDIFLRELISNANDALEKLRLTALTEKEVLSGAEDLNITIKAYKDEDGKGRIVIKDTGIGMTAEELTTNLGTLAKSGTSEFLARAESTDTTGTGNLIGAFGLGFYSSFLVADRVYVSSLAAKSSRNPEPAQYIFSSGADESSFEIYPDPRGNTLGRGTEITLVLKDDAVEYMDPHKITDLVDKHSSFASTFPIYLWTERTEIVADEEPAKETAPETDEDEAVVEDVTESDKTPKTKEVTVEEWIHMNSQPPIWMRDPKTVSDEEYVNFYQATFKDYQEPLAWDHFSGDSGSGVSFKAIIFIPSELSNEYWQNPMHTSARDIRLMVKRVFITSDLGEDALPKWASWVKVVVDAEDLPLNVSRETLQSTRFLKQLRSIILKHLLALLVRLQENDSEKWATLQKSYGNVFKLGAVEDQKNRVKLAELCRFATNQKNETSLDERSTSRTRSKGKSRQVAESPEDPNFCLWLVAKIFYLADMGTTAEHLAKSVFIEKLHARGYEVLLLTDPLDEIFVQNLRLWKTVPFQDVAKAGLRFGDEELSPEEEKAEQNKLTEEYEPLLTWLKQQAGDVVRDVVISNRLVTSSCAIVADMMGYTANVEKMMSASQASVNNPMRDFAKKQRILEINAKSPLVQGLLRRVEQLPSDDEARDPEIEEELKEVASVLIDGALVRSGFGVPDSNEFFTRVDRILRRSLGVSETAPTDTTVKPAPPVDSKPLDLEDPSSAEWPDYIPGSLRQQAEEFKPENQIVWEAEEIDEEGNPVEKKHDELDFEEDRFNFEVIGEHVVRRPKPGCRSGSDGSGGTHYTVVMSLPFTPMGPPPLPPGWTEHIMLPQGPLAAGMPTSSAAAAPKKKKERPAEKTPIPGTDWLRVKTTEGNTFYTHKVEKRSVWTVPDEIRDAVDALEREEEEAKRRTEEEAEQARLEIERIKADVDGMTGKRKAEEPVPMDEVVITKKMKVDEADEDEDEESSEDEEEEEEEWQREAAAQLAAEAEEERKRKEEEKREEEEEKKRLREAETAKGAPQLNMPDRVDLSIDEAKALFKTLLREKDVNPLHPWDTSLPLFINDPRYVLLPSVSARKEAFDEYCRDRARELRQSNVKKERETANPKEEFERLLRDEVKSTRTSWTEWRRQWKKDRRFYGWGRDDREREKRFREYLKELGEKKRAAAQKAEADFFALLKESGVARPGAVWKEVKRKIVDDPRYDAVGSSSLREELFNTYLKAHGETSPVATPANEHDKTDGANPETADERERKRRERKERAVREREEKVKAERNKVEADIDRSRMGLNKEEGELGFRTMLTDAIRDPQTTWDGALPQLKTDPRFVNSPLPLNQQIHLFHAHVAAVRAKHMASLHGLFESHTPSLATKFTDLPVSSLVSSLPATKLGFDIGHLEEEFKAWQRERTHQARLAFDQMLGENAFVEFWGRLGKIGGKGVDEAIKADDLGDDAEEEQVDMKALAKNVDLNEMVKVLKNDKRYLVFDHVPELREQWLRDYLSQLPPPKLSVHVS
ncbi:HSP90-domain-containing protein [Daedalea quercina L-15889]|uniref:HSP90-domain-containing protein n=1 Tax=Daedalea quercina L-15889 TaxID=1314783 RepID=A0A165STG1_9APHY|nr:HSP90-domain-containing protein [Daedalea quercina L-15889]